MKNTVFPVNKTNHYPTNRSNEKTSCTNKKYFLMILVPLFILSTSRNLNKKKLIRLRIGENPYFCILLYLPL